MLKEDNDSDRVKVRSNKDIVFFDDPNSSHSEECDIPVAKHSFSFVYMMSLDIESNVTLHEETKHNACMRGKEFLS